MGCDIHMFIEYKRGNGMAWEADEHHKPKAEYYCSVEQDGDAACQSCKDGGDPIDCKYAYVHWRQVDATTRDYSLFARLANVRGYFDERSNAKGLPADVSPAILQACEDYGTDGHSHSWVTLEEFSEIVKEHGYRSTKDDAFYDRFVTEFESRPQPYATIVNYCNKLKEEKSIDKHILGSDTSSEVQVRIVFWFDN